MIPHTHTHFSSTFSRCTRLVKGITVWSTFLRDGYGIFLAHMHNYNIFLAGFIFILSPPPLTLVAMIGSMVQTVHQV